MPVPRKHHQGHDLSNLRVGDTAHCYTANHYVSSPPSSLGPVTVVRTTPRTITVRNQWGNLCRYWVCDGAAVGGNRTLGKPDYWLSL